MIWPETISTGSFRYLIEIGVTPEFFATSCLLIGSLRTCALIFNGQGLPWSAVARAICATFGSVVFAHLAWMLLYLKNDTGEVSLGVGTYALLALAECYSCMRAGTDVNEIRYKKTSIACGPLPSATIMPSESFSSGEQSNKECDGRIGTVSNIAVRRGVHFDSNNDPRQSSLFEGHEDRERT